eukprot:CAMPEP_0168328578 /NCGR_PEP_ID=MMETSP0213-20121227/6593_1 /TAXON_ID=151035 /ORGANISM="Euplotes harpa, Strain FSP1.4" /LENGTH=118 /DNA_ID=CAMNT_0008331733 /DNA_START=136 /DNA_END=489 /DNA_ORIENTATION=-
MAELVLLFIILHVPKLAVHIARDLFKVVVHHNKELIVVISVRLCLWLGLDVNYLVALLGFLDFIPDGGALLVAVLVSAPAERDDLLHNLAAVDDDLPVLINLHHDVVDLPLDALRLAA